LGGRVTRRSCRLHVAFGFGRRIGGVLAQRRATLGQCAPAATFATLLSGVFARALFFGLFFFRSDRGYGGRLLPFCVWRGGGGFVLLAARGYGDNGTKQQCQGEHCQGEHSAEGCCAECCCVNCRLHSDFPPNAQTERPSAGFISVSPDLTRPRSPMADVRSGK